MSRILVTSDEAGPWYEELSVVSTYSEGEYEDKIKQYAENIFSEYHTIRFKLGVDSFGLTKKPDLALIAKDYSAWWVVEVELTGHTVEHVLEQVNVFRTGDYNPVSISKYVKRVFSEEIPDVHLDEESLTKLITDAEPQILVIVDAPTEDWRTALDNAGVCLCDLQVFKNAARSEAYKIGGDYPSIFVSTVHLKFHSLARNTLELISAANLSAPLADGQELLVSYKGRTSKWGIDIVVDRFYMKCLGKICPLHFGNDYLLKYDQSGRYSIMDC
ncbi:MAG: hypothetical protein H7Y42_14055 [Chitinophagaceae bacterium]|nr:hypothetical protein [Chitinophagaceae bacterium]